MLRFWHGKRFSFCKPRFEGVQLVSLKYFTLSLKNCSSINIVTNMDIPHKTSFRFLDNFIEVEKGERQ